MKFNIGDTVKSICSSRRNQVGKIISIEPNYYSFNFADNSTDDNGNGYIINWDLRNHWGNNELELIARGNIMKDFVLSLIK